MAGFQLTIFSPFWCFPLTTVPHKKRRNEALVFCIIILSVVPNLSWSCIYVFSMNMDFGRTRFLPHFVMATCVDEKTFYEKWELLKENLKSKITVYIDQTFYDNAKNYLEVQDEKRHGTEAELSKHDINTIKRKGWALKDGKIITRDNKIVVPKSELHKILCECHSSTAHRGRDKTNNYVKALYSEIPQQVVSLFTSLCALHAQQKSITDHKKRAVTNPIHAETFLSHVEVDLIDFRNLKCSCEKKAINGSYT